MGITGVVLGLVALALVVGVVVAYNHFVVMHQRRLQAEGDVAAQLNQRWDVVPQMAALVARYMAHETDLLEGLTMVREPKGAGPVLPLSQEDGLRSTMAQFFARAEAYPHLRADATFVRMQDAVEEAEMHLAAARRALNAATAQYNSAVGLFPLNLVAGVFGFKPAVFVQGLEGSTQRPDLSTL